MSEEEFLKKAEDLLRDYNNLREKVLNENIDNIERRKAAFKLKKIHNAVNALNNDEFSLIKQRYFENMSWYAIAKAMGHKSRDTKSIQNKCRKAFNSIAPALLPYEHMFLG